MYQNSFDQRRNTIRENSDNTHIFWIFLLHLTIKKEQQIKKRNLPLSTLTHLLIVICNIFFLTTKATWRVLHHVEKWEKHFTLGRYYQLCVLSKVSKGGRRRRVVSRHNLYGLVGIFLYGRGKQYRRKEELKYTWAKMNWKNCKGLHFIIHIIHKSHVPSMAIGQCIEKRNLFSPLLPNHRF